MKKHFYAFMRHIGLLWLMVWYDQRKLDRAHRARFNAFCKLHGLSKVKGKWIRK
jgi:hypothetical protein